MTDDFVRYAQPLVGEDMVSLPMIGGRQRLTRLKPIYAEQKLPKYVPQADREVEITTCKQRPDLVRLLTNPA